jgi:hypothetical protein
LEARFPFLYNHQNFVFFTQISKKLWSQLGRWLGETQLIFSVKKVIVR